MLNSIIAEKARREFSRVMRFERGGESYLPHGDPHKRPLLYIHVPFCEKLCPYCSFNRVTFERTLCREYFDALKKEIVLYEKRGYRFGGIYVGGGTPTIMIEELEETLLLAKERFPIREISVETNPNHLTDYLVGVLKKVGVNRLSVGVQTFDDQLLRDIDRYEKYGSGDDIARRLSHVLGYFNTLNADMMFNFPSQNMTLLEKDLEVLLSLGIDQVTYYPLMVSDSTREVVSEKFGNVDYDKEKKGYSLIVERLVPPYRFSSAWCFSRRPAMVDEYIVDYDEYAGIGSGSIGYLNGLCYANTFNIREYIDRVNRGEIPITGVQKFSLKDRMLYDFLMKLFSTRLDVSALRKKYGEGVWRYLWVYILALMLVGAISYQPPHFYLTSRGRYTWVVMMREFFTAVNNFRDFFRENR